MILISDSGSEGHPCTVPRAERGCMSRCDGTVWPLCFPASRA